MRVGGGNCHFVLASISCIVVRCVVFEHIFSGSYRNIGHTNFLKSCGICSSVIHYVSQNRLVYFRLISLLSSLF